LSYTHYFFSLSFLIVNYILTDMKTFRVRQIRGNLLSVGLLKWDN